MNRNFSENLRKIRKENNLSQEQLAEDLGVSRQAISKWESGAAYPEMDKIIALCEKFHVNIDDLLNKDIKEVKGEEESNKKINTMIDDFLKFITNTINLFSKMSFKSKVKCLFEQMVIIAVLIVISAILMGALGSLFSNILNFLPYSIHYFIMNILRSIMIIFCIAASIIILTHVFQTRYLNYYLKEVKESLEETNTEEKEKEELKDNEEKKLTMKNDSKIVIRDPKHSEYRFLNGLWKVIVIIIKFFALCISLGFIATLLGLGVLLAISLLFIRTGLLFVGAFLGIVSSILIVCIFLVIIFNFVFNRKNNKKLMIYTFLISVFAFGCGCGFFAIGSLDFEILEEDPKSLTIKQTELEMSDTLFFSTYLDIDYIPSENTNVIVEYQTNEYCGMEFSHSEEHGVSMWTECYDVPKMMKDTMEDINHKKLHIINADLQNIKVYTTQENINKILENKQAKESEEKRIENLRTEYEKQLEEKEKELEEYREKINKLDNVQ